MGARPVLVAYNLWLDTPDVAVARCRGRRRSGARRVRALGLAVGGATQVSCNLVDPFVVGPAQVYDVVRSLADDAGTRSTRAELVGLAPAAVVEPSPRSDGVCSTSVRTAPSSHGSKQPGSS